MYLNTYICIYQLFHVQYVMCVIFDLKTWFSKKVPLINYKAKVFFYSKQILKIKIVQVCYEDNKFELNAEIMFLYIQSCCNNSGSPLTICMLRAQFFLPSDRYIIGHYILGHALYKGPTFFIYNMDFMGIKRHRLLCRFQQY
jgi:hypothetical protein